MPEAYQVLFMFCGLRVELRMHTSVYAVYALGCPLSVIFQVAIANKIM